MDKIKEAGYELTTPVIVTNGDEFQKVGLEGKGTVVPGKKILRIR